MSEEPGFNDAEPGRVRAGEERSDPERGDDVARDVAWDLRRIEEQLAAAEHARRQEAEELLTRMGAVEVLIDHLNDRVGRLAAETAAGSGEGGAGPGNAQLDLRVAGIEVALDRLGPVLGVPATIAALEGEVIALGERLDLAARESEARAALFSREIEARVSVAESRYTIRLGAEQERMQAAVSAAERGGRDAERRLEARLAEQAAAAADALEDLEDRITSSLEALAGRLGTATSASGAMAESMVGRLELIERDIAEIEARFEGVADAGSGRRAVAAPTPPGRPVARPASAGPEEPAEREPSTGVTRADAGAARPLRPGPEPAGPVNLNDASFEVLRSLGCSVTQTARILAARKVRGGFTSPEELADVPGLPAEFRAELISRLTV